MDEKKKPFAGNLVKGFFNRLGAKDAKVVKLLTQYLEFKNFLCALCAFAVIFFHFEKNLFPQ